MNMSATTVKELYKVKSIHEAFYTGGCVEVSSDGSQMFCQCQSTVQVLEVESGRVCNYIGNESADGDESDSDLIISFILSPDNKFVVSSHKSNLLKLWDIEGDVKLVKVWKAIHKGPVVKLALNSDNTILATGGTDSSIRLWDLVHNACTHNFTLCQGVISVLKFSVIDNELYLYGAGDDNVIQCWNCSTGDLIRSFPGHFSKVTAIGFHPSNKYLVSCGRDKVMILWYFNTGKPYKIIPLFETVESLVVLPEKINIPGQDVKLDEGFFVATGGDTGVVKIWDPENSKLLFIQDNSLVSPANEDQALAITHLHYMNSLSSIVVTSAEHNIIFHDLETFRCTKQFVGFSDEILSIVLVGKEENHLAVATNSNDIKLYDLSSMSCQILKGHTGFVLTLATSPAQPNLFASSSKDHSIRVWALVEGSSAVCIMVGTKHTDTVHSLALPTTSFKFAVSVSQDTTLKLWNLPKKIPIKKLAADPEILSVKLTVIAHDKDINDVCVSPNDKIVATASFDKTAKLWKSDDLTALGTLRGHKRGVWSCKFSPVDQVLFTTSADSTIKLWSISDLSCLKTLEGHDSSVLQADFLTRGTQLLSAGGDGLIKLWSIKSSECIKSFDSHDGKIWSLVVSRDEDTFYSGGSDSRLVVWQDWSEKCREERIKEVQEKTLCDQRLANLIKSNDYVNAIKYAISLNRPATVLKIIQEFVKEGGDSLTEDGGLEDIVSQLEELDKQMLLKYAAHWNTNSKSCYVAQLIISMMLEDISNGSLKPPQSVLEAIIPYTERHFKRLTQALQDLHFIKFARQQINPLA